MRPCFAPRAGATGLQQSPVYSLIEGLSKQWDRSSCPLRGLLSNLWAPSWLCFALSSRGSSFLLDAGCPAVTSMCVTCWVYRPFASHWGISFMQPFCLLLWDASVVVGVLTCGSLLHGLGRVCFCQSSNLAKTLRESRTCSRRPALHGF